MAKENSAHIVYLGSFWVGERLVSMCGGGGGGGVWVDMEVFTVAQRQLAYSASEQNCFKLTCNNDFVSCYILNILT